MKQWIENQREYWSRQPNCEGVLRVVVGDADIYVQFINPLFEIKSRKDAEKFSRDFTYATETKAREDFVDLLWKLEEDLNK